jgi:2-polyprenyl-3-methyl-5-hydroxy-6-metoxy-1,4-benzoquinol methylase
MTDTREELANRLFEAGLHSVELMTVYLGDALGLYRTIHQEGAVTAPELAARAGLAERYAQEWLESQAASGFLEVDDVEAAPLQRRYQISDAYAEVLTDRDSPYSVAPLAKIVSALGSVLPRLTSAFRTGEGIPWSEYGAAAIEAQGDFNRPWLQASLGTAYLPAIPDVHERLRSAPARVADLACGVGWAGIAIARAYPQVTVDGFDEDEYSIELARKHTADAGLSGRVNHAVQGVSDPVGEGRYDLAVVIETVHDLPRPVEFLGAVRRMLAPGGVAIVGDERVGETFTAPADELERFFYAASVLCCLPVGLSEQPSAATGTVIRPATMRRYATEAGFAGVTVLDEIDNPMFRFYRLDP